MLYAHARALAKDEFYRSSNPKVKFKKSDHKPTAEELRAEDWEPVQGNDGGQVPPGGCIDCPK